jgi:hypothetical protein
LGAVRVGHPSTRSAVLGLARWRKTAPQERHERTVGRHGPVASVGHALSRADQKRALSARDGDGAKHRGGLGAAGVEQPRAVGRELGPPRAVGRVGDLRGLARGGIEHEEVSNVAAAVPGVGDAGAVRRPGRRLDALWIVRHLAHPGAIDSGDEDLKPPLVAIADVRQQGSTRRGSKRRCHHGERSGRALALPHPPVTGRHDSILRRSTPTDRDAIVITCDRVATLKSVASTAWNGLRRRSSTRR